MAGIGAFDAIKLDAYEGGDLNRLGRHDEAAKVLDAALAGFGPRCAGTAAQH